jgi:hypothetical protein
MVKTAVMQYIAWLRVIDHISIKGLSLASNAGRDDILGKFLIPPTTTFFSVWEH